MPFIIKINLRHSTTGSPIRTLRLYNNFVYHKIFNSLASTFGFDFFFDPKNQEHAEIICVSHMHECRLYYTKNTDPNYEPNDSERELTGYLLLNKFKNNGKPQMVKFSGYAKPGVLLDCDIPPDQYPLETDGLTFKQIITKIIRPFRLYDLIGDKTGHTGLVIDKAATGVNIAVENEEEDPEDAADEDMKKTSSDTGQNVGSYLSELAKSRNIVLSHNKYGNIHITTPNTKGKPIFNFDFTDPSPNSDVKKIPGLDVDLTFNGQALHTHITVKMQADDEEESNGAETTIRNPLLPVGKGFLYRPRCISISSGSEFTVGQAARYELGREIREAVPLKIDMAKIDIDGKLISPNNMITLRDPSQFLYNVADFFIQDVEIRVNEKEEACTMNCVLPFGYDYNIKRLKNVFVDAHENLPRF